MNNCKVLNIISVYLYINKQTSALKNNSKKKKTSSNVPSFIKPPLSSQM